MRNPDRVLDKTHLSANQADERVIRHRDLCSHAFRWAHIARHLQQNHRYKDAIIVDCGCGKEMPMARMLYSNRLIPKHYVGVDANKFEIPEMLQGKKIPIAIWEKTDFCALDVADVSMPIETPEKELTFSRPNIVVNLEVLEHLQPEHTRRMLQHFLKITSQDCHYFISTPCWDQVNAAENHLSEVRVDALGSLLEDLGYHIEGMWGTFASQKDYKPIMEERFPGITKIFEKLSDYYDSTVLSFTFAPLFPMESRNCLWHLTRATGAQPRRFPKLCDVPGPWTQHKDWRDLAGPACSCADKGEEEAQVAS